MKTGHYYFIQTGIFMLVALMITISCRNQNEEDVKWDLPPQFYKSDSELLGITVPFLIQEEPAGSDYTHTLGLIPHARRFYLNADITGLLAPDRKDAGSYGDIFLQLLKNSKEKDVPVRIYVSQTDYILWVEEASGEEIENYEKSKIPPSN